MPDRWSVEGISRTLLPVLLVLTVLELGSGLVLEGFESQLLRYPSLLVLVPATIGTAGNLGSVLSARVTTAVHLGLLSFGPRDEHLVGNLLTTGLLALSVFPLLGAGSWLMARLSGGAQLDLATVVAVALTSGLLLAVIAMVVTVVVAVGAYRAEVDPDNVVLPVVTNVCDVLGVLVLVGVVRLLVP